MTSRQIRRRIGRRSFLAGGAALAFTANGARAQSFPSGPVKIVTSVGPDGKLCARAPLQVKASAAPPARNDRRPIRLIAFSPVTTDEAS